MSAEGMKLKLTAVFEPAPEGGYTCHFEERHREIKEGTVRAVCRQLEVPRG